MERKLTSILTLFVLAGFLLYAVGLFKHISYPLMWADESMTAVGAQRVLQFGYPKVHDGRNVFYDLRHSDPKLGLDPSTDAYVGGAGWLQYYFAAPFVALSQGAADLYHKTAVLRIPFACAGLAGLLILLWVGSRFIPDPRSRLAVATVFILLILPSITLLLHLREVRYYPLQLLLTSLALGVFSLYHLREDFAFKAYTAMVTCLIPLLFLTFAPAALAFCLTVCLYLGGEWFWGHRLASLPPVAMKERFKAASAVLFGALIVLPFAWFFRTFAISRQLEAYYGFSLDGYLENLGVVWGYFTRYEILAFALIAKLLLLLVWRQLRDNPALRPVLRLSLFLTLYGIVHALCVGKIPNRLFTRYFITIQPLLVLVFALDLSLLVSVALNLAGRRRLVATGLVAVVFCGSLLWAYSRNLPYIKGRFYEMTHQYQGVLDYVIPYLSEHYDDPSRLVIATNYEETSYIYYLGSRVMVGFLNPDLAEELQRGLPDRPDAVVYRKFWAGPRSDEIFQFLLSRDNYATIRFPVLDYGFNNIPEVVHWTPETGWEWGLHYFATETTADPEEQTVLFLREDPL